MIEELLKTFVSVVDTQLFEAIKLDPESAIESSFRLSNFTHLENLETSNVQHTDEKLSFSLDIERDIDTLHEPAEHSIVDLNDIQRCGSELHVDAVHLPLWTEHRSN